MGVSVVSLGVGVRVNVSVCVSVSVGTCMSMSVCVGVLSPYTQYYPLTVGTYGKNLLKSNPTFSTTLTSLHSVLGGGVYCRSDEY